MSQESIITEVTIVKVGANKTKVAIFLKNKLKISLQDALKLVQQNEIIIKEDKASKNNIYMPIFSIPHEEVEHLKKLGAVLDIKTQAIVQLKKRYEYKLKELVNIIKERDTQLVNYALYTLYDKYDEDQIVYIDEYPYCDDDDDDIYPDFIKENDLKYFYSGEQFVSVIQVAISDKNKEPTTVSELIKALEYYSKHDTFMSFD